MITRSGSKGPLLTESDNKGPFLTAQRGGEDAE
jgi:hypothetical protein